MKNILETIINNMPYDDLGDFRYDNLKYFSKNKKLFDYQIRALENMLKALKKYFTIPKGYYKKRVFFDEYVRKGIDENSFQVPKYLTRNDRNNLKINPRFKLFTNYFDIKDKESLNPYIESYNFINRMAFWMATGSGKSLVLIKAIEIIDYLQNLELIDKRDILLLLPREDLIKQFQKTIDEFNRFANKKIDFISLKDYEDDKRKFDFGDIKVYYYRSDLIRDERKENILDFKTYDNNGRWYIFLDEAHRGKKEDSLAQDYFTILSRNGFLFNFSATFTDEIDKITTVYNFNLEKFINAGYGKNIYLSESYFNFKNAKDDFSKLEKQKQVLKSLITFSLIKKSRVNKKFYHSPLLVTLVNSVNTDNSDLLLFFKELDKIAKGDFDEKVFTTIKEELKQEFSKYKNYVFGDEELDFDFSLLENLSKSDLLKFVFNTNTSGKIEFLEGEKGKELILKLESSEKPFALIKIGDTSKFKKEKIGIEYNLTQSFETKKYFEHINEKDEINLLLGSRSFYEGWDSNRPNVLNLINIGKGDAKKFVLQGIGRGVRIEPIKGKRKRLLKDDPNKNILLETLFIYATDKKSVQAILEEIDNQKISKDEINIGEFFEKNKTYFDLLIPKFIDTKQKEKLAKFNISFETKKKFLLFLNQFSDNVLLVKYGLKKKDIEKIKSDDFYQIKKENIYSNFNYLLEKVVRHRKIYAKEVEKIDLLKDEIIHFKHIKVINLSDIEIESLKEKIEAVKNFKEISEEEIDKLFDEGKITREKYKQMIKNLGKTKSEESFKDLKIKKILQHYYLPLIYSTNEKQEYIKHIITVPSEVRFIENLEKFINKNKIDNDWMFSKIDESLDNIYIPYYYKKENVYKKFYPDFIFWIKKGNRYKIVFVDPKGTKASDYQNKVDELEKLFLDENKEYKIFKYKNFEITFDLKLVTNDINSVSEKYEKYWLNENSLDFIKI